MSSTSSSPAATAFTLIVAASSAIAPVPGA